MTAQELRASLLQEAVTGRLVPQRAEEGSAEALYEEIRQEKARLIAEKKIKKEKPLPPVTEEEQPFSIPATWRWVRLGSISTYSQPTEKILPSQITDDLWSLDLEDIEKNSGKILTVKKAKERRISGTRIKFYKGQILYCKLRPYLKKILVAPADGITSSEMVPIWLYANINPLYLVYFLKSPATDFYINSVTYGIKMPRVGTNTMINLPVPLPPLAEQKRIVDKLEELLPLVDAYGEAEQRLAAYEDRFPDALKRSLLQEAITGRLVPQRAEEGSAETLYEEIRQEKARLVAEKKIKKEKPLPPVTEEEQLFPIPASWKWIRLEDVCSMKITDGTHQTPKYATKDNGIPFLSAKDITTQKICWDNIKYITTDLHEELYKRIAPQKDDVLLAKNGTTGVAALVEEDKIFDIYVTLAVLRPEKRLILPQFLWRLVNSPVCKRQFDSHLKGIGVPNLHLTEIRKILIPLPPLAEQKRIVAKLEELLALAERIREARR